MRSYIRRRPHDHGTHVTTCSRRSSAPRRKPRAMSTQLPPPRSSRSHGVAVSTAGAPKVSSDRWSGTTPSILTKHLFAVLAGRFGAVGEPRAANDRGALAAMHYRDFSLFFSAALLSNTGTWMQTITVPYVLDQLTHSTVWVGVGAFCTFFPATVVGPIAGSLADRYSRRTILLCSQVVLMLSALALWGIWVSGIATPPLIVGCVVVGAIGAGITIAAWQAFVPQLVPPEAMVSAVRLNGMQFTGARAFGPALAGLVLAQFGPGAAFMANALSFLLVIGALLLIAARPVAGGGPTGSVLAHFREGVRYVRKRAVLVLAVLGALLSSLLGVSMIQLAEPFTRQVLHEGAGKYGLLVAGYGVGAITGSIVTVARGDAVRRSTLTLVGFAIFIVAEITFGLAP